jgi:uncharacterized membrane protein
MITALIAVAIACLGVHLGLFQKVAEIAREIAACEKCSSFWLCSLLMLLNGHDITTAVLLSVTAAYLSYWLSMLLILLNALYEKLWQRINKLTKRWLNRQ